MQDFRLAVRALRSTPIVSAVAIVSLALGIGANTAMFSLVNSLLLRSLPVKEPRQLAILGDTSDPRAGNYTYAIWDEIRHRPQLFDGAFAWSSTRFNLSKGGQTEFIDGLWASGRMFETLGVPAILGRTLSDADDVRGGGRDGPVAVISYTYWQRRYDGDPRAIGQTIDIERVPFTIIGVTPPSFFGTEVGRTFDVTVPIGAEPLIRGKETFLDGRSTWWLEIMARLKPGQSIDAAQAALRGVQSQIRAGALPTNWTQKDLNSFLIDPFTVQAAGTGDSSLRQRYERPLMTLLFVVALVLLIACANIANLLMARATARRHELSVRLALGASKWRLARQLLVESLVMSLCGAVLGLLLAQWASRLLVQQLSTPNNHVFLDIALDWRVLVFTMVVTVATALLFGTAPAFRASSAEPMEAIKEHGRSGAGDNRIGLANGLVVAQVMLSLVLVVAAGLFVRTFSSLANLHLGFDRDRVLVTTVNAQRTDIPAAERLAVYERIRQSVAAAPGVAAAGVSVVTPVSGMSWNNRIEVSDGVTLPERQRLSFFNAITPGWLATFGTPVVAGRDVAAGDTKSAPHVILVNQAFARRFLNGANPIGHTVVVGAGSRTPSPPMEIVGMVGDAVYRSLRDPVPPTMYVPLAQFDDGPRPAPASISVSVRSASESPALLTRTIADAIARVNPDLALTFRPLAVQVNASLTQERLVAMLAGFFGGLALLLAGLGLYGVTSYAVSRRRTEIGIRMALGAAPAGVVRLVLARVTLLVGAGIVAGSALSVWAARFVSTLLYGLQPRDPVTIVSAAVALAAVGALAGWLPAYRASRIDPAEVLRDS
ncbi:MAG TPA: ABC transporter permease [Vicinamibacterales bacterium]